MRLVDGEPPEASSGHTETQVPLRSASSAPVPEEAGAQAGSGAAEDSVEEWRDRALRLQAEMENYRKRQRRLAEEQIAEGRERLIRRFLQVADELERALTEPRTDTNSLRQGVDLTYRSLMQLLKQEGVEKVPAQGQPFDPQWHEAVGALPQHEPGIQLNTVIEVLRPGYRIEEHLLRPARVVVSA